MTKEDVFAYAKKTYGVEPDCPFPGDFETAVLRHQDTGKWFGIVMQVKADRLGYTAGDGASFMGDENVDSGGGSAVEDGRITIMNMKSEPMLIDGLVWNEGFHRAYHMNKKQWITVELNDKVSAGEVQNLLDLSYSLTEKTKKVRSK